MASFIFKITKMYRYVFYAGTVLLFVLMSCNRNKKAETFSASDEKKIARVYDKVLYLKDIKTLIPAGTNRQDSITLVKSIIDNWVKKNLVIKKAEDNLGDVNAEIENQIQEYRNSLIIFMYEQALIRQQLDTVVSDAEIVKYYNSNQSNFELKQNIVQCIYLKTLRKAPRIEKLKQWLRSNREKDGEMIEEYCHQYSHDFFLNDDQWILFDELVKNTGIETYNQEDFLRNNRYIELADSTNITFVRIKDFKIKESLSPIDFEKENIKTLIINKRKMELIGQMERAAYDNALKNNDFELYKN